MATSGRHRGWLFDATNARLAAVYNGTEVMDFDANDLAITAATTGAGLVTGSVGLTATTGDIKGTAGNLRLGAISAFASTEPTSAVVMKVGTNPVGAITTSNAIFTTTGGATISKIIAASTVSQIEA